MDRDISNTTLFERLYEAKDKLPEVGGASFNQTALSLRFLEIANEPASLNFQLPTFCRLSLIYFAYKIIKIECYRQPLDQV